MDDYLFIVMAKLKADRSRLERELLDGAGIGDIKADAEVPEQRGTRKARWPFAESPEANQWNPVAR
ncbi:MAG: hypothetical protein ACJ8OJ_01920 [Povalibacter sp.]